MHFNNYKSFYSLDFHGIPQKNILVPLLFNVNINDIVNIDDSVKFVIYAGDSSILIPVLM